MPFISLVINIIVLIPVCWGLISGASWVQVSYGEGSPARGILLSIYLTILIVSVYLLFNPDPKFIVALLMVQIIYKFTTPLTVGTFSNSVVISNVLIATFHLITVGLIWKGNKL